MDQEITEIHQKQAELEAFRTSDISEIEDTDWIPPYAEWFCDHDIIDDTDDATEENTAPETNTDSEQDEEKTSADYRSFDPLPISVAAYDQREVSSREDIRATALGDSTVTNGTVGKIAGFLVKEWNDSTANLAMIAGHPKFATRAKAWRVGVHVQDLSGSGKYIGACSVQGRKVYGRKLFLRKFFTSRA